MADFDWGSLFSLVVPGLVKGGTDLLGNLYGPNQYNSISKKDQAQLDYEKWNSQFEAQQAAALEQQKLEAEREMASISAGAQVKAADIAAGAERDASMKRAQGVGLENRMQQVKFLNPEVRNSAATTYANTQMQTGENAQKGMLDLASLLQNPLLRAASMRGA